MAINEFSTYVERHQLTALNCRMTRIIGKSSKKLRRFIDEDCKIELLTDEFINIYMVENHGGIYMSALKTRIYLIL